MQLIKSIVRPNKLDDVKEALGKLQVSGMTAIQAIISAARTGEIGDGRVFIMPVTRSYKIRTGEKEG